MTKMTTETINALFANRGKYNTLYFQILAPNGRHRHPQFLMKDSATRMLSEGYSLYFF